MRFSVTGTSASQTTRAQVLGDYLLPYIAGASERQHSVAKLYVIAWKQSSVTLVSSCWGVEIRAGERRPVLPSITRDRCRAGLRCAVRCSARPDTSTTYIHMLRTLFAVLLRAHLLTLAYL